jgi:hypothetical protein
VGIAHYNTLQEVDRALEAIAGYLGQAQMATESDCPPKGGYTLRGESGYYKVVTTGFRPEPDNNKNLQKVNRRQPQ